MQIAHIAPEFQMFCSISKVLPLLPLPLPLLLLEDGVVRHQFIVAVRQVLMTEDAA